MVRHQRLLLICGRAASSQSRLFLLIKLRSKGEHSSLLQPQYAHQEVDLANAWCPLKMLYQEKQLIKCFLQLFVLLDAFFDEFAPELVDICLNLAIDGTFARIECDSHIVEGLLLEALIGCEGRHYFRGHHMEDRCQEVIEADEVILISIQ